MRQHGGLALGDAVHDALHELVDGGRPPVDPGPAAVRTGRRIRRRHTAVTSLAALALVAVVAAPVLAVAVLRDSADQIAMPHRSEKPLTDRQLAEAVIALPGPLRLPGGFVYAANEPSNSSAHGGPTVALDVKKDRYVWVKDWVTADPSPAGNLVLVSNGSADDPALLDLRTGETRPLGKPASLPGKANGWYQWSPDGKSLLYCKNTTWSGTGVCAVVDAATGNGGPRINLPVPRQEIDNIGWMPDGRSFFVVVKDPELTRANPYPRYLRTEVYDLSGKLLRSLPLPGNVEGTESWSPDGKRVLVTSQSLSGVYDARTGAVDPAFSGDNLGRWWVDNTRTLAMVGGEDGQASGRGARPPRTVAATGRCAGRHRQPHDRLRAAAPPLTGRSRGWIVPWEGRDPTANPLGVARHS